MAFRSSYGPDRGGFGGPDRGDGEDDVFRVPDKDVYRKNISSFGSIHTYLESRFHVRKHADRRIMQPHYTHLKHIMTPYGNRANPADGVCTKFLRKGLIKPNKIQMNVAVWSADSRWLVLGTQSGDIALWEGDTLKVRLLLCIFLCLDLPTNTHLFTLPLLYVPWGPGRSTKSCPCPRTRYRKHRPSHHPACTASSFPCAPLHAWHTPRCWKATA